MNDMFDDVMQLVNGLNLLMHTSDKFKLTFMLLSQIRGPM